MFRQLGGQEQAVNTTFVCVNVHLIVLQQYEAEVELREGQLQVLNVSVFASLLLRQGEHRLPPPQAPPVSPALPLGVQR